MHIDDTYEKCYGYTQGMKENDGYSGSSSAKGTDAGRQKKARQKELLEEYLEKRAQAKKQQLEMLNKKIAKMELERSRQTQSWNSERQMAKASNAYDGSRACEEHNQRRKQWKFQIINLIISIRIPDNSHQM